MTDKTYYQKAQEELAEFQRQASEKQEQKALKKKKDAERLIHVLTCKIDAGVKKGETFFTVNADKHSVEAPAIDIALEKLVEMGFPRDNISCVSRTLQVRVDPPAEAQAGPRQNQEAVSSWICSVTGSSRREEAIALEDNLVNECQRNKANASEKRSFQVKISSGLMREFECSDKTFRGFESCLRQRCNAPQVYLILNPAENLITMHY